jgi:hypothetical protein
MKKLLFIPLLLMVAGCSTRTGTSKEASAVASQQKIYVDSQPIPFFDWSLERNLLIETYKARNNAVVTYSYVRNFDGQIVFSCKSIGFPIASNTQLTSPESLQKIVDEDGMRHDLTLPQAEPNGTFSSPSTAGTYVFCLNDDGSVSPSYFEANVETHTTPLSGDAKNLSKEDASLKIKTSK